MTEQAYTQRVFQRISGGKPDAQSPVLRSAIQLGLPDALRKLAVDSINTDWRALLEFDYTLTIASGAAPFTSNTDLLPESIKSCNYIKNSAVATLFRIVDDVNDLDYAAAISFSELAFAAVGAVAVYVRWPAGTLNSPLTVRAVKVPALSGVPTQLDDRLIDRGVILSLEKLEQMQAAQ